MLWYAIRKQVRFLKSSFGSGGWSRLNFQFPWWGKEIYAALHSLAMWGFAHLCPIGGRYDGENALLEIVSQICFTFKVLEMEISFPNEDDCIAPSESTSPTPDISLRFRPTFFNWMHGTDTTPGFLGCPVITSAEHVQSLPHQLLPSFPWLCCVFYSYDLSSCDLGLKLQVIFGSCLSLESNQLKSHLICDLVPAVFHHGLQLSAPSAIASRQPLCLP